MIIDLCKNWKFITENGSEEYIDIPHDAMLKEKRYSNCRNGIQNAYFPGGKYIYVKTVEIKEEDIGKYIELIFEGVYRESQVYINNQLACTNIYGYSDFSCDISDLVVAGTNVIRVIADNTLVPNCRWYTGSGIYRPVWLKICQRERPTFLKISTISYKPAIIEVLSDDDVQIEIFDKEKLIYSGNPGKITIKRAKLWSAEKPYLYRCVAKLGEEIIEESFGVRLIEYAHDKGLLINGTEVLLRGACIHHDNTILGAVTYPDAEERKIKLLKEAGFNAVRLAHNPGSRNVINACDKLGMYVMDEAFDGWYIPKEYHDYSRTFYEHYLFDLKQMVNKDYNHPSVIMYSIGNEVTETAYKKGWELAKEMTDYIKTLDITRPVTVGINVLMDVWLKLGIGIYKENYKYERKPLPDGAGYKEKKTGSNLFNAVTQKLGKAFFFVSNWKIAERICNEIAKTVDIIGLNYAGSRYDKDAKKYPNRMMVGSETMVGDLPYNWERVKTHKQVIGDFVWAGYEYLGEACFGDWIYPSYKGLPLFSGQGMLDPTGFMKAQMHFMRVVWGMRKEPFLCIRPLNHYNEIPIKGSWQFTDSIDSWNWHGYEGKKTTAEVYSDSKYVKLELDGKKIKIKKVKDYRASFKLKYAPGVLTAIALDKNKFEISRTTLKTGSADTYLRAIPSKKVLKANTNDLSFVEIEFVDNNGNLKPVFEQQVKIDINDEAIKLIGFGSGLCKTDEVFDKKYHDSYRGRCLACFKATNIAGKAKITISSKGVKPIKLTLECK